MIVALCADKGSPGVTTATVALAMAWPGNALVVDADPAGGDWRSGPGIPRLAGRIRSEGGLLALAADARLALSPRPCRAMHSPRSGVSTSSAGRRTLPVVSRRCAASGTAVADTLAAWPGTAIADLGRLYPGTPARWPLRSEPP